MCGRMTQLFTWPELARLFDIGWASPLCEVAPRYNVAPGQDVVVVRARDRDGGARAGDAGARRGGRTEDGDAARPTDGTGGPSGVRVDALRWGLVPSWADDERVGYKMINARGETLRARPAFRDAYRARRCLVPASGFFEWRTESGRKQPYYLAPREGRPPILALAGLWERWTPKGRGSLESFTIVTTEPNATVAELHDRMPVVVPREHFALWLHGGDDRRDELDALLVPADDALLSCTAVNPRVNRVAHDDPACLQPVPDPGAGPTQNELF